MFAYPYPSWEQACRDQSPDLAEQLDRKEITVAQLRDTYAAGVTAPIAPKRTVSWPATATLMAAAARRKTGLTVLDFGGAFAEYYYQNIEFLRHLDGVRWHVVEEAALV